MAGEGESQAPSLSAAQRARMERNRLKARALHEARLVRAHCPAAATPAGPAALDSGGGFLLEATEEVATCATAAPPAPLPHASLQPQCLDCGTRFPHSYLLDTFDYSVCDACRQPDSAHALLTRTEVKSEFLLKDCDLDARPPPLKALVRRNPHAGRGAGADMRLYVRALVEARAREVWGGEEQLREERARRDDRRGRAAAKAQQRRLRALRMDVRSGLYRRDAEAHRHRWGPERHDAAADEYSRACLDCGHTETYEKM